MNHERGVSNEMKEGRHPASEESQDGNRICDYLVWLVLALAEGALRKGNDGLTAALVVTNRTLACLLQEESLNQARRLASSTVVQECLRRGRSDAACHPGSVRFLDGLVAMGTQRYAHAEATFSGLCDLHDDALEWANRAHVESLKALDLTEVFDD